MSEWTFERCAHAGPARLYDRWPWIHLGVVVLMGAAAAATWPWVLENPRWLWFFFLAVPALVLHELEEFVLPGDYHAWFNRHFYGSANPFFPMTKLQATMNHMPLLPLFLLLGVLGSRWPFVGMGGLYGLLADGVLHITATASGRRYSPGVVTSLLLYLPLALAGTHHFVATGEISTAGLIAAGFGGVVVFSVVAFLPTNRMAVLHPALLRTDKSAEGWKASATAR